MVMATFKAVGSLRPAVLVDARELEEIAATLDHPTLAPSAVVALAEELRQMARGPVAQMAAVAALQPFLQADQPPGGGAIVSGEFTQIAAAVVRAMGGQFPDVKYVDWLGDSGGEVIEGRFGQDVDRDTSRE